MMATKGSSALTETLRRLCCQHPHPIKGEETATRHDTYFVADCVLSRYCLV